MVDCRKCSWYKFYPGVDIHWCHMVDEELTGDMVEMGECCNYDDMDRHDSEE